MRSTRGSRVVRGTLAAAFATFVALLTHLAGGGSMPGWVGIAVPLVLSAILCILLTGRRISALRTTLGVVVSQLFFHTLFVLGAVGSGASDQMMGHVHGAMPMPMLTDSTVTLIHADATMWLWHGVAALITAVAFHRSELTVLAVRSVAESVRAWIHRVAVALIAVFVAPRRARTVAAVARVASPVQTLFAVTAPRRGPPTIYAL